MCSATTDFSTVCVRVHLLSVFFNLVENDETVRKHAFEKMSRYKLHRTLQTKNTRPVMNGNYYV